ncbi:MAG: hypothetical protein JRN52_11025 [Nitrososphaerota archaeon]|nr:hypothetical protein [Nitrososphaerota archaeon]
MPLTEESKEAIRALSDASYEALKAVAKKAGVSQRVGRTHRPRKVRIKPGSGRIPQKI